MGRMKNTRHLSLEILKLSSYQVLSLFTWVSYSMGGIKNIFSLNFTVRISHKLRINLLDLQITNEDPTKRGIKKLGNKTLRSNPPEAETSVYWWLKAVVHLVEKDCWNHTYGNKRGTYWTYPPKGAYRILRVTCGRLRATCSQMITSISQMLTLCA